jgi:hypothetical protein
MLLGDDSYDNFNYNDINNLNLFNFEFSLNEKFVHVRDKNGKYFECQTPFLKVLKPIHSTFNKKKKITKKYLILETNDELDFNNQIGEFIFIINKIHEISQEKIKEKSMEWFNTEFDEIGLDIKIRRPIDQQKESEFIKICIPYKIESEISKLSKETYVLCNIIFKGLKISNDYIHEEWEILDFITQEKYEDNEQNFNLINNIDIDKIQTLLDNDIDNNIYIENNIDNNIINDIDKIYESDNIKIINQEKKIFSIENDEHKINTNKKSILLCENIENNINIVEKSIYNEKNSKEYIENTEINNLNDIILDKNKIKKNKITNDKIIGKKIIKNNELIKKKSKKIVFN